MGNFPAGGSTFVNTWAFHTGGLSGPSASGTFQGDPTSFNRLAVSYDPVNKVAVTSINGQVLAAVPYTPSAAIKYVASKAPGTPTWTTSRSRPAPSAPPPSPRLRPR